MSRDTKVDGCVTTILTYDEAVREHLDGRVPRHAVPDSVEVVDEIPLTDVGKTDKVALRERSEEPRPVE